MESYKSLVFLVFGILLISFATGIKATTTPIISNTTEEPIVLSTTKEPIVSSTTNEPTTPFPDEGYNCTDEHGSYAHPIYCEYYYDCTNGLDTLIKCQKNYLFDLKYDGCNYPSLTDCQDRTRPEGYPGTITPPTPTGMTPPTGMCEDEDGEYGLYPDPEDCTAFYQCSEDGDDAYHMFCPFPLRFNEQLKVCDYAMNVDCGERPLP